MKAPTITALEQLLSYWEDFCFCKTAITYGEEHDPRIHCTPEEIARSKNLIGKAGEKWSMVRKQLLHMHDPQSDPRQLLEGASLPDLIKKDISISSPFFPYLLASWIKDSRRVFKIDRELQSILLNMSYSPELGVADVCLPFNTFMIELEDELEVDCLPGAPKKTNWLIVHSRPAEAGDGARLNITYLYDELVHYQPISSFMRARLQQLLQRHRFDPVYRYFVDAEKRLPVPPCGTLNIPWKFVGTLTEQEAWITLDEGSAGAAVLRLVVGFLLYLQTLTPQNVIRLKWEKVEPKSRAASFHTVLSHEAQVCAVTGKHLITSHDMQETKVSVEGQSGRELSPHFRRGYWRRSAGHGNDPEAPKIIMVAPTIVRKDRLQPGEMPGGAVSHVK